MINILYSILAFLIGFGLITQTGVNTQLRVASGSPILAAFISFLVGTIVLFLYILLFNKESLYGVSKLQNLEWYKWTGGLIGALYVSGMIIISPRIGAANTVALLVTGQLIFSLVVDHFGWLGFPHQQVNVMRMGGAALLIAGVFLILKY